MFLITSFCNWKCCGGDISICQNSSLNKLPSKELSYESLYKAYINNPITKAIVIGGLEPFMQTSEVYGLIKYFRDNGCDDTFVIYTGYTEEELQKEEVWDKLMELGNLVIKFGRYVPNQKPHFDEVLGVELISDNQYAKRY